ncbi:MAG: 5'/3'-nucleotidase SurE [Planctomycetota bacterium]
MGKILLTNDDGINAEGIFFLWEKLREFADVIIVAPDKERSGSGHALTLKTALKYQEMRKDGKIHAYSVSGTPVDCVRLAAEFLVKDEIDLVVSGINNGANMGINLHYSGTVAAALEAAILGIPGVAVSIASPSPENYESAMIFGEKIVKYVLASPNPSVVLNVNVPARPVEQIKGILVTKQALTEVESNLGTHIMAHPKKDEIENTTDIWFDTNAVLANYVSITPIGIDLTKHNYITQLSNYEW